MRKTRMFLININFYFKLRKEIKDLKMSGIFSFGFQKRRLIHSSRHSIFVARNIEGEDFVELHCSLASCCRMGTKKVNRYLENENKIELEFPFTSEVGMLTVTMNECHLEIYIDGNLVYEADSF